ncbi:MAG: argininosuccinate lyase [Planctomycetota bacterium]|nr:argininosuccinate lyase [Planctomycetota bacterium]
MALWGGRFEGQADPLFRHLNDSFPFDHRLIEQDLTGSKAWARGIARAGVLSAEELTKLLAAIDHLLAEHRANPSLILASIGRDEDVHSYVERRLVESLGSLGKKLHTGRSRNDQVATDLRLWARAALTERLAEIAAARTSLLNLAERELRSPIPGYTHLQRAQPVLFSHWALAYERMLARDAERFRAARASAQARCPLGSAALAGTTFPVDRAEIARDLGFDAPSENSLDAVSDRDFVVEALNASALAAVHLSRLGEDLIVYSTQEFSYVDMSDAVTSGSSLMPQKKNPDACELLRGKAGRIIASAQSLMTTLKGLPLSYNKDLQEDKEPLFDAMEQLSLVLRVTPRILDGLTLRRAEAARGALGGYANATELADYLVAKGMPFRDAHDVVGRIVRAALALPNAPGLHELPLDTLRAHASVIGPDVFDALSLESSLRRREIAGGTGPGAVTSALSAARAQLARETESKPTA